MSQQSTIQPFEKGDIFAGATLLNNPNDDHAGDGRIIQFDSDLNEKGVLWTKGTTHLIGGLKFGPDGNLWAFDGQGFKVLRITPDGEQLPDIDFPKRQFSSVNFDADGNPIFGEHTVGNEVRLPPDRPLGTTIPFMPGTDRFGDGHVFKCALDGSVIQEYATESHGGMPGFLGVTGSTLAPDGKTLVYMSELGNRLFRYDINADQQLPDLITYTPESGDMAMAAMYGLDGTLYYVTANFRKGFALQILDDGTGEAKETFEMDGMGWAALGISTEPGKVLVGNFFTGTFGKFDVAKRAFECTAETNVARSLAGLAQYAG